MKADLSWGSGDLISGGIPGVTTNSQDWLVQMYLAPSTNSSLEDMRFYANGQPDGGNSSGNILLIEFHSSLTLLFPPFGDPTVTFNETISNFNEIKNESVYTVLLDTDTWSNAVAGVNRTFVLDGAPHLLTGADLQVYTAPNNNPGGHAWQWVLGGVALGTETFVSDLAGWLGGGPVSTEWLWSNGYAMVQFDTVTPPAARTATFTANNTSSAGRFAGNYADAGVGLIGFDFIADDAAPTALTLNLFNGAEGVSRNLTASVPDTGTWHQVAAPLVGAQATGWQSINGGTLNTVLSNVTSLEIAIDSSAATGHSFRIDNIFLGLLPATDELTVSPTTGASMDWIHLRSNWLYRVEGATNIVNSGWSYVDSFLATNEVFHFTDPEATNTWFQLYRLRID